MTELEIAEIMPRVLEKHGFNCFVTNICPTKDDYRFLVLPKNNDEKLIDNNIEMFIVSIPHFKINDKTFILEKFIGKIIMLRNNSHLYEKC
jgi:hypothetical protein